MTNPNAQTVAFLVSEYNKAVSDYYEIDRFGSVELKGYLSRQIERLAKSLERLGVDISTL
jgi:hypothetical protein